MNKFRHTRIVSPGVQENDKEFNYTISNIRVTGMLSRAITIISFGF